MYLCTKVTSSSVKAFSELSWRLDHPASQAGKNDFTAQEVCYSLYLGSAVDADYPSQTPYKQFA